MICYSIRKYSFYNNIDEVYYYINIDIFKVIWICISIYKLEIDMVFKYLLFLVENFLYFCIGVVESFVLLFVLIVMR